MTVSVYERWRAGQKKNEIADFIYERLYRRYVKPFEFNNKVYRTQYKNGFAIMATSCLLIETLESFYRGWGVSKSEMAFLKFFTRDQRFSQFSTNDLPSKFYKHVRCGILHQGETTGGWKISRKSSAPLLSEQKLEINANKFSSQLKLSLGDYCTLLKSADWKSEEWECLKKKMKIILSNCK